jgi:hypothetical protein
MLPHAGYVTTCRSGLLDLVGGEAAIDIQPLPLFLIHQIGIGKPVRQVPDQRPQHRIGIAKLALHGFGINDIDHRVEGGDGARRAFALAHDRGHLAKKLPLAKCRQQHPLA